MAARTVRLGREVTGQEAQEAIRRDQWRKGQADPVGSLFRSGAQTADTTRERKQSRAPSAELPGAAGVGLDRGAIRADGANPCGESKKAKKDKRDKRGKKHKKKSTKRRRKESERNDKGGDSSEDEDSRDVQRQQALVRTVFCARSLLLSSCCLYVRGKCLASSWALNGCKMNTLHMLGFMSVCMLRPSRPVRLVVT